VKKIVIWYEAFLSDLVLNLGNVQRMVRFQITGSIPKPHRKTTLLKSVGLKYFNHYPQPLSL